MKFKNVLCVDLDYSLIKSDLLFEQVVLLIQSRPMLIFKIFGWIFKGPYFFKQKILQLSSPSTLEFPWRDDVLLFLKEQKRQGRTLWLVSASPQEWVDQVGIQLPGLFDQIHGSHAGINLKGAQKAQFLVQKLGAEPFTYVGDSLADWPVFKQAQQVIAVGTSRFVQQVNQTFQSETHFITTQQSQTKIWVKALRVHQWAKNALIFLPLFLAHQLSVISLLKATAGFLSFSLLASAIYLINDLFDLPNDRHHGAKKQRPLAAGILKFNQAIKVLPILLFVSFFIAGWLPSGFMTILFTYLLLTSVYTFYVKSLLLWDVVSLAGLFTIRLYAGQAATGVLVSEWLLTFSIFLFFSLALLKRYIELRKSSSSERLQGRAYQPQDQEMIAIFGAGSGLVSLVILSLYLNQSVALALYQYPERLLGVVVLMLFWITRIWLLAHRGQVNDDPIVFALKDRVSLLVASMAILILWIS